ncbi:antibiotic biosynthesis monooxygenase [Vibrio sp. S4M6]|uniref:putative quinol monooxygenase n=1 Tax=Vibrio sinus TaxID=2946865 RepID=UPI00202A6A79|nr:antibiotic biosynthesis monooxygenase [Vibrio sinus]MCL9781592.1 antibiotic biosynthesis monooxygenase [Vibrio sinus]
MSKKIYCTASFKPKAGKDKELFKVLQSLEPNSLREEGCIQYVVTRKVASPFAEGVSFPIVFHEVWADKESFETHCQRREISDFFEIHCLGEAGLVEDYNVCVYSDEPEE